VGAGVEEGAVAVDVQVLLRARPWQSRLQAPPNSSPLHVAALLSLHGHPLKMRTRWFSIWCVCSAVHFASLPSAIVLAVQCVVAS